MLATRRSAQEGRSQKSLISANSCLLQNMDLGSRVYGPRLIRPKAQRVVGRNEDSLPFQLQVQRFQSPGQAWQCRFESAQSHPQDPPTVPVPPRVILPEVLGQRQCAPWKGQHSDVWGVQSVNQPHILYLSPRPRRRGGKRGQADRNPGEKRVGPSLGWAGHSRSQGPGKGPAPHASPPRPHPGPWPPPFPWP